MYFWNYLEKNLWNNKLSYNERKKLWSSLKLFVPNILEFDFLNKDILENNLSIWEEIVFEEVLDWKLHSKKWLKNYITWKIWNSQVCIFDNHNVAFYFIGEYFLKKWKSLDLIHIDQHSDMYEPDFYLNKFNNLYDIEKYTFEWLNVWNYLLPLQKLWFIKDIYQKRTQIWVLELDDSLAENSILNIDLDFWEENMSTDEKSLLKIKKFIWKSPLILFATSPYFIEQQRAIELVKKILFDF